MSEPNLDIKSEAVIGDGYVNTYPDGSKSAGKIDVSHKPPSFSERHPILAAKAKNVRDFLTYFAGRKSPFTQDEKTRIEESSNKGKDVGGHGIIDRTVQAAKGTPYPIKPR